MMAKSEAVVRNYHHGNLAVALKTAALALVRERGPNGFSLSESARRAGVAASAPYRHFSDRDALLISLAIDGNDLLARCLAEAAAGAGSPLEAMIEIGVAYVNFASRHHDYFDVMFNSGIDRVAYPALVDAAQRSFGIGVAAARLLADDPERQLDIAFGTWTLAHGIATLQRQDALAVMGRERGETPSAMTRRLVAALLSGGLSARIA